MASKGQSFTPTRTPRQQPKGQSFTPTHIPRKPAGPALQRQYAAAPTIGRPQPAAVPARPAVPVQLAPPPLVAQPMPLDPVYEAEKAAALADLQRSAANAQYQRGQVRQEYGFEDTSNPYNRAAMLQRAFEQSQNQNLNNMASSGQLYSGATQATLDEGSFQHGRSYDQMRREYEGLLQGLTQAEAEAQAGYLSSSSMSALERTQRALETRPYVTPTVVAPPQGSVKGQSWTPTKIARPKSLAKNLQKLYAKAPKVVRGL